MGSRTNVPRWNPTPTPSPTRPLVLDTKAADHGEQKIEVGSTDFDIGGERSSSSLEIYLPFSRNTTASSTTTLPLPQSLPHFPSQVEEERAESDSRAAWLKRGGGVFLTWKDLWVKVAGGEGRQRTILEGLTGYAQPAEVLAILGPSGCGKSTLLDALAGRLGSNIRQTGDILVNGRKQALAFGTSVRFQNNLLCTSRTRGKIEQILRILTIYGGN
ncbi:hypothetical protein Ancab_003440 [Ancistrocladus abbreviatus]